MEALLQSLERHKVELAAVRAEQRTLQSTSGSSNVARTTGALLPDDLSLLLSDALNARERTKWQEVTSRIQLCTLFAHQATSQHSSHVTRGEAASNVDRSFLAAQISADKCIVVSRLREQLAASEADRSLLISSLRKVEGELSEALHRERNIAAKFASSPRPDAQQHKMQEDTIDRLTKHIRFLDESHHQEVGKYEQRTLQLSKRSEEMSPLYEDCLRGRSLIQTELLELQRVRAVCEGRVVQHEQLCQERLAKSARQYKNTIADLEARLATRNVEVCYSNSLDSGPHHLRPH